MSVAEKGISGLVRVTVAAGERRMDFALPGSISVAELLPELARSLGVLDPQTVHTGFRLHTADGQQLIGSTGLAFQNIHDGALLTITVGLDEAEQRVYDDVVEAMADVVEDEMKPWDAASARRTALVTAAALLGLGALAIGLQRPSIVAGALAGVVAILLVAAALVVARVEDEHEVALMLGWAAVVYAAVCGLTSVSADQLLSEPLAAAGAAAMLLGFVSAIGLVHHRALLLPAVTAGALTAASSAVVAFGGFPAAEVYTVTLVFSVLAMSLLPWLALGAAGNRSPQPQDPSDMPAEPSTIQARDVRAGAALGHEVLLGVTVTIGLLVVLIAPLAVSLGVCGTLIPVCGSVILMLRTRQHRAGSEVAAGLGTGLAGLLSVGISVLVLQPEWRPILALALAGCAAATLVVTLVPSTPSVARGRIAEIGELVALVAMLPLLVIAIGVVASVRS